VLFEQSHNPVKAYEESTLLSHVHYSTAQHVESQTEGSSTNWAGRLGFSVALPHVNALELLLWD
jgi:hypothetical protein